MGEFKTEQISFRYLQGENKTGRIQSCIQYFGWGKMSRTCSQYLSLGGYIHDYTPIDFMKSYRFYFCAGEIFAMKAISRKKNTRKISMFTVCIIFCVLYVILFIFDIWNK